MGYAVPTNTREISCSWQCHRDRKPPSTEPGTDYAGPNGGGYGAPLYAAGAGTVVDLKHSNTGATGRYVTIDLDDGRRTRSLHLSEIWVSVGQRVSRGQQIGKTGASANGNNWGVGAHVHQTLWARHAYSFGSNATLDFDTFVGPVVSAGNEREVGPNGANGRSDPSTAGGVVQTLAPGTVGTFNGWKHGENVQGNDVWFRGALNGNWFWSGGFNDTGTHDLENLNAPTVGPTQRQVVATATANGRSQPQTGVPVVQELAPNTVADFNGWIRGQNVEGNDVWFRGAHQGNFFWSGGFTDHGTHDLADLNPVTPPPASPIRVVGVNTANVRNAPYTNALITGRLDPGAEVELVNWARSEEVQGNATWFQRADLGWVWSGGFTSQATDGLTQIDAPPAPAPTDPLNPANLPEYEPVWATSLLALEAPLGFNIDGSRASRKVKGNPPVITDGVIRYLILHHCATTVDQLYWFSTKNSRDVCPSYYFRRNGDVFELIRPGAKPATTGAEWNYRSISVEMLNSTGAPTWELTQEQRERAAQLAVEMYSHTVAGGGDGFWDGAPIEFALTREFIIGHNDALPGTTECPGPDMHIDDIVRMAQELWAKEHPEPGPDPQVVEVPRATLESWRGQAHDLYEQIGDFLA